jgi:hypothetical protein
MVTSEFDSLFAEKSHEQYEPVSSIKVMFDCDSVPERIRTDLRISFKSLENR